MEKELLDISKDGDDNAILLAVSVILQGYRNVSDLSELLGNISTDIREDGVLNSTMLDSLIMSHAKLLNLLAIRQNIENKYALMGVSVTIPDFEKFVRQFLDSANYEFTNLIEYPEFSDYGENILFGDKYQFRFTSQYSLAANLPTGTSLKIILKGGLWYYWALPAPANWLISVYDKTNKSQEFKAMESGKSCDLKIEFADSLYQDNLVLEYYENSSPTPTKTKNLEIFGSNYIYPNDSNFDDSAKIIKTLPDRFMHKP